LAQAILARASTLLRTSVPTRSLNPPARMKVAAHLVAFTILATSAGLANAALDTPVSKALELLSNLEDKIAKHGEEAAKVYREFSEWCGVTGRNLQFEIKTGKAEVANLEAAIESETARSTALSTKIEDATAAIASDEDELKSATAVRTKEAAGFAASEKELLEIIDELERAGGIVEREMQKGEKSFLQGKGADDLVTALGAMVQSSGLRSADASRLSALVQAAQSPDDGDVTLDETLGAPSAAAYASHSQSIVDTLADLSDKAQGELSSARQAETSALHNFALLKQSLEDRIAAATKDVAKAKKALAESGEKKAATEGDLAVTRKALKEDITAEADLKQDCMAKAEDYAAAKERDTEQLSALAKAKQVIAESTSGAASMTYGLDQTSFIQTGRATSTSRASPSDAPSKGRAVLRFLRDFAQKHHAPALAQLATKAAALLRLGGKTGEDPFAKVKGLISEIIERLEGEASAEASHKAFCDKELANSGAKKEDAELEVEKITTRIEQMATHAEKLKEQVAALRKALAELVASQGQMDKLRAEESAIFATGKAEMEKGIEGVKYALRVLRDYYATQSEDTDAAAGAGSGIIGLLQVVESDFSKGLAQMVAEEDSAAAAYEQESKDIAIEKATKEKDVEYKTKEAASLDQSVAEASSDRSSEQAQLDAITEYVTKLQETCVAKPETYEQRAALRAAEIAGLKEALEFLRGDASFLQQRSARHLLRGVRRRAEA